MRMDKRGLLMAGLAAVGWATGGCAPEWRPRPAPPVQTAPAEDSYELARYLPSRFPVRQYYLRRDMADSSQQKMLYSRIEAMDRRTEGLAVRRKFDRLQRYYPRAQGESAEDRPYAPFGRGGGGFLQFDPPLAEFPARLHIGETFDTRADVRLFWGNGSEGMRGELTRQVTLEMLEPVEVKAGRFGDCLRLRVDMELKLGLAVHLVSREYQWLAPATGEVRRVLNIWGRAFLTLADQTQEYELAKTDGPVGSPPATPPTDRRWARAAVLIGWKGLSPYPGGLVLESDPEPAGRHDPQEADAAASPTPEN